MGLLIFMAGISPFEKSRTVQIIISAVENLKGAKFIRNGSEHNGKEAAMHLLMKLQCAGSHVQTAEGFIRVCASQSYTSGKPYMIRLSNGKTIKSEEYFREKLKDYISEG